MIGSLNVIGDRNLTMANVIISDNTEYHGDANAFSVMLNNAIEADNEALSDETQIRQTQTEKSERKDIDEVSRYKDAEEEDIEIELTFEAADEAVKTGLVGLLKSGADTKDAVKDFGEKSSYTKAISGLNSLIKKNVEITDGKHSAVHILDAAAAGSKKPQTKIKIKLKDLDVKTRAKISDFIKNVKSGIMTQTAFQNVVTAAVKDAPAVKNIMTKNSVKSTDKAKVRVYAGKASDDKNSMIFNGLVTQKRNSAEMKPETNKIEKIEKNESKTFKTTNTEVSRKNEKTRKTWLTDTQNKTVQNGALNDSKELITEFTLKAEGIAEADKAKGDVKTILSDNREAIFNKMVENTKTIQSQNMTKFSMVMRPESVGRMDFQLTVKDGKMNGRIILQNSEAADFFRANIEEITAVFRKANVELGKLDVSLAGQQFHSETQTFADGRSNGGGQSYSRETLETVQAVSHLTGRAVSAYQSHSIPVQSYIDNNRVNLLI